MRRLSLILLPALLSIGCGGNEEPASSQETAPVSLAIPSPQPAEKISTPSAPEAAVSGRKKYSPEIVILLQRARAAVTQGRHAGAIEALSQAIGSTPDDSSLFRMRADVYALAGENANARADFSTAIRLAPDSADLLNARGYFLMTLGIPADALQDFDAAISRNPQHTAALNNRGLLQLAAGQYETCVKDFSKAIAADSEFMEAWNNRAYAHLKSGNLNDAMSDVRQAIRIREDYPTAWNNCGLIAMEQEDYREASRAFTRAIELSPLDIRLLQHRREAWLKLERFQEAGQDAAKIRWLQELEQLTAATGKSRGNPALWIRRGEHLMAGSEFGAAVQDFTRAILLQPKNPPALTARARAWLAMGDTEKALLDCDQALSIEDYPEARSLRGDLYLAAGKAAEAVADFETAGRFDQAVAAALTLLAEQQTEAGDTAAAAVSRRKAASITDALTQEAVPQPEPPSAEDNGFDPLTDDQAKPE